MKPKIASGIAMLSIMMTAAIFTSFTVNESSSAEARDFWPHGGPTNHYVLPGQNLGFFGADFAPNEQVKLYNNGTELARFTTDNTGGFRSGNSVKVPYEYSGSVRSYRLVSQTSRKTIQFSVVVGRYYPQIQPSSYYVAHNARLSVHGRNFAPNEPVELYLNGKRVSTVNSDGSGNVNFGVTTPAQGNDFMLKAIGTNSRESSERRVYLHWRQ